MFVKFPVLSRSNFAFHFLLLAQSIIMRRELFQIGSNYSNKNLELEILRNYPLKKNCMSKIVMSLSSNHFVSIVN